jgi:hypothetical protein
MGWSSSSMKLFCEGGGSSEFEIPPEQYEQDMQAEDEQYIQAGNEGLTGQQVELISI